MALSLLNAFVWKIEDAKVPFLIADAIVIVSLQFFDRGLKAEKKLRDMEAAHAQSGKDSDKLNAKARDSATREAQKQAQKQQKSGGGSGGKAFNIQQPSKRA